MHKKIDKLSDLSDSFTGTAELIYGSKFHFLNGEIHREDGPAIEYFDGNWSWFDHGKMHRVSGPAAKVSESKYEWWLDGKRVTPNEVFDKMNIEQKEKFIWDFDKWLISEK
jgi:hypothetical protein